MFINCVTPDFFVNSSISGRMHNRFVTRGTVMTGVSNILSAQMVPQCPGRMKSESQAAPKKYHRPRIKNTAGNFDDKDWSDMLVEEEDRIGPEYKL